MGISKREKVLRHLQMGMSITQLEAWDKYNTFTLAQIIQQIRKEGYPIRTTMRHNGRVCYAEYRLEEKPHQAKLF